MSGGGGKSGHLTCQTNGKLFRFRRAKLIARNFQTPAVPAKPKLLSRVDNVDAIAREGLVVKCFEV